MKRILLFLSSVLSAQQALDAPPLAHVLDADGHLTAIYGLAGNFIAGPSGPLLLAYSSDGEVEWRLEPGRLSATRAGSTAVFATIATRATFNGEFAVLPESNETVRLVGDSIVITSEDINSQVVGRAVRWQAGKLQIFHIDGTTEEIDCLQEPDAITAAAAEWAHLRIGNRSHLLRLTPGRAQLFVLPERRQE